MASALTKSNHHTMLLLVGTTSMTKIYPLHILFGLIDVESIVKDYLVHLWDASLDAKVNLFGLLVE